MNDNRIGKPELDAAVERYGRALDSHGLAHPEGWTLALLPGSKAYGQQFKLVWIAENHTRQERAIGTDFGGDIGWSRREAYQRITMNAIALEDLRFQLERQNGDSE